MGSAVKWTEQFGFLSDSPAAEADLATSENLFAALINGDVPEHEYISWAQEQFELPFVRTDYFSVPADQTFWDRLKDVHPWKPHLFPIADWDGCLLIACVEPVVDFHIREPHRFVLARAGDLNARWTRLNPDWQPEVREEAPIQEPVATPPPAPQNVILAPESPFDKPEASVVIPDGVVLDFATMDFPSATASTPAAVAPPPIDIPDGFGEPIAGLAALSELPDGFGAPPAIKETKPASPTSAQPSVKPAPPTVKAAPPPPPPPPPGPMMEAKQEEPHQEFNHTLTGAEIVAVHTKTTATLPKNGLVRAIEPKPLAMSQDLDDLVLNTLSTLMRTFDGAMIIIKTDQGLEPFKYTAPFSPPVEDYGPLRLDTPSIFRIVHKSGLPYHGYTTPAPENDRFFNAFLGRFSGGKPPASISIVPVSVNSEYTAFLLAISKEAKHFRQVLPAIEALARQFAEVQEQLGAGARAA